jgi:Methyltransferase domain
MPDQKQFIDDPVPRAFSKQAEHYDQDDGANPILVNWRKQVYRHVDQFIKPVSNILELNAGTGIDALRFAHAGHTVLATDYAPGMIQKIQQKIEQSGLSEKFHVRLCSFESLDDLKRKKFDYVFSNFGGLNCSKNIALVTRHLPALLDKGAYVTWVIMPPVSLWELSWAFKGNKAAFRRLNKDGALAHLEGEYFKTYYYSLADLKKAFGREFKLIKVEGLGSVSPPPSGQAFIAKHPTIHAFLNSIDGAVRNIFPFNRWADHIIVTFQFTGL